VQLASGAVNRTTTYLHRDHLGSVDTVTSEAGTVLVRMSFDAHGNRRAAMTSQGSAWSARLTYAGNTATVEGLRAQHNRGFTDHEMLDNVGLIHMNGRVYDPVIGRFLSVDPVFQFPENTQSLNPYSYVRNSPLSATDPTGFCEAEQPCEVKTTGGKTEGGKQAKQEKQDADGHKMNKTRDPRSGHFANANRNFNQAARNNESGDIEVRNLANGNSQWTKTGLKGDVNVSADGIESLALRGSGTDGVSGGNGSLASVGGISGSKAPIDPKVREQMMDQAMAELAAKGFMGKTEFVFTNKFAIADYADDGSIARNSVETFDSWAAADKAMGIRLDNGRRASHLNGQTVEGSNVSEIFAGALGSGTVDGFRAASGRVWANLSGVQAAKFVALHEQGHGIGYKGAGARSESWINEDFVDGRALELLGH
jgi:RHS repeat-associated protein